jgi:ATPase subunit of ABC transporter with duplicated ATPase domains
LATRIIELDAHAAGGLWDYSLESYDDAYAAYMALRTARRESEKVEKREENAGRARYEEQKREEANRRNAEKRKVRAAEKVARLEEELATLEEELFGSAATDYIRAAEIEARKAEIEEELLALYEMIME